MSDNEEPDFSDVESDQEESVIGDEEEIPKVKTKNNIQFNIDRNKEIVDDDEDDDDEADEDDENDDEDDDADDDDNEDADGENIFDETKSDVSDIMRPTDLLGNTDDENYSDDDDEEDDPNYLQKFDESIHRSVIAEHHPELQTHNYEEIEAMCRVVRDESGEIIDPLHKTLPFLSRYEKARILGERAKQIDNGAKSFVEIDETIIDGYLIACKEFEAKRIPFIIKRPLPNGTIEYWRLEDLVVLE